MSTVIPLCSSFSIPSEQYAIQGNAILGIRDSGKTYTATKIAEHLMDAQIPFIAYDPVGVWKFLKVPGKSGNGFPVVVAGGDDTFDIKLTPENAVAIVRAAMKNNINLVIDLYSPSLATKSSWIKIVRDTIHVLMYENKNYGLRHIFLEEAAEFIPQVVRNQHSQVYAEIERVARMGRNAKLGITIINQRAEEVNKAILEICEMSLLHKQVGRNSLFAIKKWLDLLGVANPDTIIKILPTLGKGYCYAIGYGTPKLLPIDKKKSFHPSPSQKKITASQQTPKKNSSLEESIRKIKESLNEPPVKNAPVSSKQPQPSPLVKEDLLKSLQQQHELLKKELYQTKILLAHAKEELHNIANASKSLLEAIKNVDLKKTIKPTVLKNELPAPVAVTRVTQFTGKFNHVQVGNSIGKDDSGKSRMLAAASLFPNGITIQRMAFLAGLSHTSGTFNVYLRSLKKDGFLEDIGMIDRMKAVAITAAGKEQIGNKKISLPESSEDTIALWSQNLGANNGATKIFQYLCGIYPNAVSAEELAEATGFSASSGTFNVYQRKLRSLSLVEYQNKKFSASSELF
jgi:hypothetical protein